MHSSFSFRLRSKIGFFALINIYEVFHVLQFQTVDVKLRFSHALNLIM